MVAVEDHALSVRLAPDLYELLRKFAFDQRRSQTDVIREALKRYISEQESPS